MKILQINFVHKSGGVGKIAKDINDLIIEYSYESYITIAQSFTYLLIETYNKYFYFAILPVGVFLSSFTPYFKLFVENNLIANFPLLIQTKVSSYLTMTEQSVSTYNLWFMYVVLIYLIVLFNIEKFDRKYIVYVKILGLGILMSFFTLFLSDMSLRITNTIGLLLLFLIPDISKIFKQSKYVLYTLFLISFLIFYNTHFRNHLLHMEKLFGDFVPISKKSK
jgi:hypothetical protein